jgi:hypothetical protein
MTQTCAKRQAASSAIEVIGKGFERKSQLKATSHENTLKAYMRVLRKEEETLPGWSSYLAVHVSISFLSLLRSY